MNGRQLPIDLDLLRDFENHLDPLRPEQGAIPARVLGYGEISTVFEIGASPDVAYKRMPIFRSQEELAAYEVVYREYHRLLIEEIGLRLPAFGHASLTSDAGQIVFFAAQERLDPANIGSRLIQRLSTPDVLRLVRQVLRELARVWRYNRQQQRIEIGIDGQISNWAVGGYDPDRLRLGPAIELTYLDTSTPLFRIDSQEQLDVELFLRSAPSFLAWLLRRLFLADVVGRYYDLRRVTIDLIANFYKEQLPNLVPDLIDEANSFFTAEASDLGVAPITQKEVQSYYREDAFIWRYYQAARRIDRFLHRKLLHKPYPYILPEIRQR